MCITTYTNSNTILVSYSLTSNTIQLLQVVEERWGSLGQLAASISTYRVASSYAHLQSIRGRKAGQADNSEKSFEVDWKEDRQGVSSRDHAMRKLRSDSVPWKKNRHNISFED